MKWIVASALLTAMPYWVSSALADVAPEKVKVQTKVVVVGDAEDGDAKKAHTYKTYVTTGSTSDEDCGVVWVSDGSEGKGRANTFTFKMGDGDVDGHGIAHVIKLRGVAGGDGAWLGISMGPVPDAVDAQTGAKELGVMILNVVEGSPADSAGLASHDIILSIDGESAEGDIGGLVKAVGDHKPGDQVDIVVLRDGKEQVLTATLGSRKDSGHFKWKFDMPGLAELNERVMVRGKFLRKGDDGEWEIGDLGDLGEIAGLPDHLRMLLPKSGNRTLQFSLGGDHKTVKMVIKNDDTTLEITQENDGEIVVTRTDANGEETVTTYADAEELQAGDEEAYEAYQHTAHVQVFDMDFDGLSDLDFNFDFDIDELDFDGLHDGLKEWRIHIGEAMGVAGEQYEEAMEKLHEALADLKDESGNALVLPHLPLHTMLFRGDDDSGNRVFKRITAGKARQSFELKADGTIEVRIRKGDSELLQVFDNEADLESRDPTLFEKYRSLMDAQD